MSQKIKASKKKEGLTFKIIQTLKTIIRFCSNGITIGLVIIIGILVASQIRKELPKPVLYLEREKKLKIFLSSVLLGILLGLSPLIIFGIIVPVIQENSCYYQYNLFFIRQYQAYSPSCIGSKSCLFIDFVSMRNNPETLTTDYIRNAKEEDYTHLIETYYFAKEGYPINAVRGEVFKIRWCKTPEGDRIRGVLKQ